MANLRIIQVGIYPEDINIPKGGVETSVYGLVNEMSSYKSLKVKVIDLPRKGSSNKRVKIAENIELVSFKSRFNFDIMAFFLYPQIIREIKLFKPDICHIHGSSLLALLIAFYLKINKAKYIFTVHGIISVELRKAFQRTKKLSLLAQFIVYGLIEYTIINMSNNILVNTIYVRDWVYKKKVFNSSFSVHVLPQGIEKQFCLIPDYNLSNWLLSVGSLSRRKGYEYSIKAIKLLIEKYPNLQYKIIGFNSDMKYLEELRVLIAKLGLENNISLLPNLDKQEILDYLAKGNIFLLHSEEESQGIVFCEAMAAGKPIVATSVGGVPFVVKHKDNGFLSEYGDIKTFSEHIDLLLCDVKLRNTMSKRNRAKGLEYTWAQITTEVLSIYNNILNFHRPIVNKTSKVLLSSIN